ncbi:MAG: hypothetical protein AB7R69_06685 [Candidatus Babeliales bacterium]
MLKFITSSPRAQQVTKFAKESAPTAIAFVTAGAGLLLLGMDTALLNFAEGQLSMLSGSLSNFYGQGVALVAEATLAVAALRSGSWAVGQMRKVSELEKENASLKAQLEEQDDEDLKNREKELQKEQKALERKESSLKTRETRLKTAQEKLKAEKDQLKQERKEASKQNHDKAKNLSDREQQLIDDESAVRDWKSDLERERLLLQEAQQELAQERAEFEASKQLDVQANSADAQREEDILQKRPAMLPDFGRKGGKAGRKILASEMRIGVEDLSSEARFEESSASHHSRRSPSPGRSPVH